MDKTRVALTAIICITIVLTLLESLADRKLMKRVHGGYAITLKGLLAVKVWRLHLFLFHHGEYKYFRRKK